jgi:hypothetical protein
MRSRMFLGLVMLMLAGIAVNGWSQGRGQGWGGAQATGNAASQDIVSLAGTVTFVNMAPGQGMPSVTINTGSGEAVVRLGPYRTILNSKLDIQTGQAIAVKAFRDPRLSNTWVATEITVNGTTVSLRDSVGMPQPGNAAGQRNRGMMGMRQGAGPGMGQGSMMMRGAANGVMSGRCGMQGACLCDPSKLDLTAKAVLNGNVVAVNMAPGQGIPAFTLNAGGQNVTIIATPYHLLLEAGFSISVNDSMSVAAYPVAGVNGTYAAASLDNLTTGKSIKLRDDSGAALCLQGDCPMKANCRCNK